MNLGTAFVLAIVVVIVALAARATFKKKGSCGCDGCSESKTCSAARMAENLAGMTIEPKVH